MRFYVNCFYNGRTIIKNYVRFLGYRPICSEREYRIRNQEDYSLADKLGITKNKKGFKRHFLANGIFVRAIKDETYPSLRRWLEYKLRRNSEFKTLKDYNETI